MGKLARPITPDEAAAYDRAGVVLLRGVLDLASVNALRRCIDEAIAAIRVSPSGYDLTALTRAAGRSDLAALAAGSGVPLDAAAITEFIKASGKPFLLDDIESAMGRFLLDTGVAARQKAFRRFAINGPGPEIAAALLRPERLTFFGDQIFVKEPGTRERTAFHQDAGYFEIEGEQCCVLWMPVDPATLETGTILYLRGSHSGGKLYRPNFFVAQTPLPGAEGEPLPDIEARMEDYAVVHFEAEPGDVIAHHYRTVHGAGGNRSRYQVRRAASLRYCGDDIRFRSRPWAPAQLHRAQRLKDGDPLGGPDFPVVWSRPVQQEVA